MVTDALGEGHVWDLRTMALIKDPRTEDLNLKEQITFRSMNSVMIGWSRELNSVDSPAPETV